MCQNSWENTGHPKHFVRRFHHPSCQPDSRLVGCQAQMGSWQTLSTVVWSVYRHVHITWGRPDGEGANDPVSASGSPSAGLHLRSLRFSRLGLKISAQPHGSPYHKSEQPCRPSITARMQRLVRKSLTLVNQASRRAVEVTIGAVAERQKRACGGCWSRDLILPQAGSSCAR